MKNSILPTWSVILSKLRSVIPQNILKKELITNFMSGFCSRSNIGHFVLL